jgi:hypothetical protein
MATYKYAECLEQNPSEAFDAICRPGSTAPHSGIYRCVGCGVEVASNQMQPLPPRHHHQHNQQQGAIRWQTQISGAHRDTRN